MALLGGVALLEKVWLSWRKCATGGGLWGLRCSSQVQSLFLLPVDLDVELSSHHLCTTMLTWCNGVNLWTVSQFQLNAFLYKSYRGHGVSHSNRTLTKTRQSLQLVLSCIFLMKLKKIKHGWMILFHALIKKRILMMLQLIQRWLTHYMSDGECWNKLK